MYEGQSRALVSRRPEWEAWGPQDEVNGTKSPSMSQTTGLPGPPVCKAFIPTSWSHTPLQHNINTRAVKETSLGASNLKSLDLLQFTR